MTSVNPCEGTRQHQKTSCTAIQHTPVTHTGKNSGRAVTEDQAAADERVPTLAEKINRLFETVHPPERGPYSNAEVEGALAQRKGGPKISATYLYQLRSGRKDNPTRRNLEALVSFFGVDPAYFFDDDAGRATFADLELLAALRGSADVRQLALRAIELEPEMCSWLARTVQDMPRNQSRRRPRRRTAPPTLSSETCPPTDDT